MSEQPGNLVSLREHLEALISSREKAVEIAAKELERRLDVLNHAHAKAQEDRSQFVKVETHVAESKAMDTRMKSLELRDANMAGRWWALGIASSVVGALAAIIAQGLIH